MTQRLPNYVRTYRKSAGLSQRELALVLGYPDEGQISRHEHFSTVPPLEMALRYEAAFHVPVSKIFGGLYECAEASVQKQLTGLKDNLKVSNPRRSREKGNRRKIQWLLSLQNGTENPQLDERASSASPHSVRPPARETRIRRL
jgi:transcriptional regulator with XRE-family HTH domain